MSNKCEIKICDKTRRAEIFVNDEIVPFVKGIEFDNKSWNNHSSFVLTVSSEALKSKKILQQLTILESFGASWWELEED